MPSTVHPNPGSPQIDSAYAPRLLLTVVLLANVALVITLAWGTGCDGIRSQSLHEIADRLGSVEVAVDSVRLDRFHDSIDRVGAGAAIYQGRCKRIGAHIAYYMEYDCFGFDPHGPDDPHMARSHSTNESIVHPHDSHFQIVYTGRDVVEATECCYLDAPSMYHENFTHELILANHSKLTSSQPTEGAM